MSNTYAYEIVSVDPDARCMEVVYTSEGKPTMHVGARLPFEGETVEAIVKMYAPLSYWDSLQAQIVPVEVGVKGVVPIYPPANPVLEVNIKVRNDRLFESDWTQLPDAPLTPEHRQQWAVYRQDLRDLPEQPGFPDSIVWPTKPSMPVTIA